MSVCSFLCFILNLHDLSSVVMPFFKMSMKFGLVQNLCQSVDLPLASIEKQVFLFEDI